MGKGKGKSARNTHPRDAPTLFAPAIPKRPAPRRALCPPSARARGDESRARVPPTETCPCATGGDSHTRFPLHPTLPGQAPQFDLATALTKKETRVIRKAEYMIPYHMARCPNYGWKESPEYAQAEGLKERISAIEAKAKKRWEANFF